MGAGIAQVASVAGHEVRLHDTAPGTAARAVDEIRGRLGRLVDKGRLSRADAAAAGRRLRAVERLDELAGCGLVIEAVVEDLDVKRELFAALEAVCGPDPLLASNTSSLAIGAIAAGLAVPGRLAGMHFFNPAPLLPLVEIVSGDATDPAALDTLAETARAWGKTPVRCASSPGFIVNRVARPFYAEGFRLLEAGTVDASTLDALLREAGGFRMGPCELTDLIGQDVNAAVTRSVWEAFDRDPRFEPAAVQDRLIAEGRLGRKAGHGFYDDGPRPEPATTDPRPRPGPLVAVGTGGPLEALVRRLDDSGYPVAAEPADHPVRIMTPDGVVRLTDGRTAAEVVEQSGDNTVLVDLTFDFGTAGRVAVAAPADGPEEPLDEAIGCLQAAGMAVTVLPDRPGMVVARTVAMLAAFGAEAVDAGVATASDVDTAMRLGVTYPRGPIDWGDALGWDWVTGVLDALAAAEDPERYRVGTGVRRRAATRAGRHPAPDDPALPT